MYSEIKTAVVCGLDSYLVRVEADISDGMPMFSMVGYLSSEVKEAKERVRTALKNRGITLPVKRITVNMSPASIRKDGTGLDLPIAISVMAAMGLIDAITLEDHLVIGELGLNGNIHGVRGILPMVISASETGLKSVIVPEENRDEATLVPGINVIGVSSMEEVLEYIYEKKIPEPRNKVKHEKNKNTDIGYADFEDINGMALLRRAGEVAACGMHNFLMIGPPGSGKTMLAKSLPSILPSMDMKEKTELSKIYSVCGLFGDRKKLMDVRPFRSPHHTISEAGLSGGGTIPTPGEISLAHGGILFLDELLEFRRATIEILRQPMEEKKIHIVRSNGEATFPADFMLVTAMNPCPCGYYPDRRCRCSEHQIRQYLSKLSQPLLDRIDICVDAPSLSYDEIKEKRNNESSEVIRKRVEAVHEITRNRYKNENFNFNSQLPSNKIEKYCSLSLEEQEYIERTYERLGLTARSYHKILRVARTIADMDKKPEIELKHLKEAICYRTIEKEGAYGKV